MREFIDRGRMARSAVLLSMGTFPSVRKNRRYYSWFRLYWSALQVLPSAGTFGRLSGLYLWIYRKVCPGGTDRRSASHPVRQQSLQVPECRWILRVPHTSVSYEPSSRQPSGHPSAFPGNGRPDIHRSPGSRNSSGGIPSDAPLFWYCGRHGSLQKEFHPRGSGRSRSAP